MKRTFLKSVKLMLLLSTSISQIIWAQDTIEPYFSGLPKGIAISETCSNYRGYSINLTEKEGDQQFDLYKSTSCSGTKTYSLLLSIEASLAGIWQEYLVFDEGTDVNGHNLRLVSLTNSEDVYILYFEGSPPVFDNEKITYFAPSEEEATAKQCIALGIDYGDLKENSAGVLIGHKAEFLLETKKSVPVRAKYTCYAIQ